MRGGLMTWAKRAAEALAGAAGAAVSRLPGMAGAGLVSAAGWMVYQPLGLALAGGFCLAVDWRMR